MDPLTTNPIIDRVVETLAAPDPALLETARTAPEAAGAHDRFAARIPALSAIELRPPMAPARPGAALRVAAWNAERLKHHAPSVALFESLRPDVILLSEADIGMARSGNRHTVADLAAALGMGYAYGVEFVELNLGDEREETWHRGARNAIGFHGNAILSRFPLEDVALIRLDAGGRWFGDRPNREKGAPQRRLGARMALAARPAGSVLVLVTLHLESDTDAADRAAQIRRLLAALDARYGQGPMVIGGDCNTAALPYGADPAFWVDRIETLEPMFTTLAEAGFDWRSANDMAPTQRQRPDGHPKPPFNRIDWLFTRGVAASSPRTVAAVDAKGSAISDHDPLVAEIAVG